MARCVRKINGVAWWLEKVAELNKARISLDEVRAKARFMHRMIYAWCGCGAAFVAYVLM